MLPIASTSEPRPQADNKVGLLERVRREVAAAVGADIGNIAVDIRIATPERTYLTEHGERRPQLGEGGRSSTGEPLTEAEHETLERYLLAIMHKYSLGKLDEKSAVSDIAHAFATLHNESLESALAYFRATRDGKDEE